MLEEAPVKGHGGRLVGQYTKGQLHHFSSPLNLVSSVDYGGLQSLPDIKFLSCTLEISRSQINFVRPTFHHLLLHS